MVEQTLEAPGNELDESARSFFESRFTHDFSSVRVHTDAAAAASARAIGARAYTSGNHIVFEAGRYSPHTTSGRALLAHELTHVVQQRSRSGTGTLDSPGEPAELEADRNADNLATAAPVTFAAAPAAVARDSAPTVEVEVAPGPNVCGLEHHSKIEPAVRTSLEWLNRAIDRLEAFIRQPAAAANAATRAALDRHFKGTDAALAGRVRDRLVQIRTDITSRDPFTVECHPSTDPICNDAGAYVPGTNRSMVVFCPTFFEDADTGRASTIVHEMAHTQLGGAHITDRAYARNRAYRLLSTAEAETNAESYALLTEELGTGRVPAMTAPRDDVSEKCGAEVSDLVRVALARAERWNRDAVVVIGSPQNLDDDLLQQHLGNSTAATRAAALRDYRRGASYFSTALDVVCNPRNCGARNAYGKKAKDRVPAGMAIGASMGAVAGAAIGAVLGAPVGMGVAGGFLGGLLGGLVGLLIGLGIGVAASSAPSIVICPTWRSLGPADRIEAVLAAFYEGFLEMAAAASRQHAALARAIHERHFRV